MRIDRNTLVEAINIYGKTSQKMMLFEEMAELQKEICKSLRGEDNEQKIIEELADVHIMLAQIKIMYGIYDEYLQYAINKKMKRLRERLKDYENTTSRNR